MRLALLSITALLASGCAPGGDVNAPAAVAECRAVGQERVDACPDAGPYLCPWETLQAECGSVRSEVATAVLRCFEDKPCFWHFDDPNTVAPCLERVLQEHRTDALDELVEAQEPWGQRPGTALFLPSDDVRAIARCYRDVPPGDSFAPLDECLDAIPGPYARLRSCGR